MSASTSFQKSPSARTPSFVNHCVTVLVNSTGGFAEIDWGSALAIMRVYISENLGNFEETTKPVLLKDPAGG